LGYTLGAVDIAYNEYHNQLVVFEVNANPGLQGSTLESYATAIAGWYKEKQRAV
jgi:D-alanine-D-alanine ligase-like ATP-grasp enzyme